MSRLHPRHLDQKRLLAPRDYCIAPTEFGVVADTPFEVPSGGDVVSMRIAEVQHRLICQWDSTRRTPSVALLSERFAISKQTISRVVRGERWAGETGLSALTHATRPR